MSHSALLWTWGSQGPSVTSKQSQAGQWEEGDKAQGPGVCAGMPEAGSSHPRAAGFLLLRGQCPFLCTVTVEIVIPFQKLE